MDTLLVLLYVVSIFLAHLASNCALREAQNKHSLASGPLDGGSTTEPSSTPGSAMPTNHQNGTETNEKRKNRASRPSRTATAKVAVGTENQGNGQKSRLKADRVDRWRASVLRDVTNVQASRPITRYAFVNGRPAPFSVHAASLGERGTHFEPSSKANAAAPDDIRPSHKATTDRQIDDVTEKFARFYKAITEHEQEKLRKKSMNRPVPGKMAQQRQESPTKACRLTKEQEEEIDAAFIWIDSLTREVATPATTGEVMETDQKEWQEVLQTKENIARLAEEDRQLTIEIEATLRAIEEKDGSRNTMESPNVQATLEQEHGQGTEMPICASVAQLKRAQTGHDCSPEQANSQNDSDQACHEGSEQKEEKMPESSPITPNTDMPETPSTTAPLPERTNGVEPTAEQAPVLQANANRLKTEKEKLAIQIEAILMAAEQEEEAYKAAMARPKRRNAKRFKYAEDAGAVVPAPEAKAESTQVSRDGDPDQDIDAEGIPDDLYEVDSHFGSPFDSPIILPVDGSATEPAPLPEDIPVAVTQESTIPSPPQTPVQETGQSNETNSLEIAEGQNELTSVPQDPPNSAVVMSNADVEQLAQKLEAELDGISQSDSEDPAAPPPSAALEVSQPVESQPTSTASEIAATNPEVHATQEHAQAEGAEESRPESATDKTDEEHTTAEPEHEQFDGDEVPDDLYDEVDSHFGSPFDSPTMLPVDSSVSEPASKPEDVPAIAVQSPTVSSPTPDSSQEADPSKTDVHSEQECKSEDDEDADAEGIPDDLDDVDSHFGSPFDSPEVLPADESAPEPAPWPEDGPGIPQQMSPALTPQTPAQGSNNSSELSAPRSAENHDSVPPAQQTEQIVEAAANGENLEDEEQAVEKELELESEDSDMPELITPSSAALEVSRPAVNEPASVFDLDSVQVISCIEKDHDMEMLPLEPEAGMEYDKPVASTETMDAEVTGQSASSLQMLIPGSQVTVDADEDMQDAVPETTQQLVSHSMPVDIEIPRNAPVLPAPLGATAQVAATVPSMPTQQPLPRTESIEMEDVAAAVPPPVPAQRDLPKVVVTSPIPAPASVFATHVPQSNVSGMQSQQHMQPESSPSTLADSSTSTQRTNGSLASPAADTSTSPPPSNAPGPSSTNPSTSPSSNSKSIWSRVQYVPLKPLPPFLPSSSNPGASSSSSSSSPLMSMESMRSAISMVPIVPRSVENRTASSVASNSPQPPATSTPSFRRSAVPVRSDTMSSKIQAMRRKPAQEAQVDADTPSSSSSSATALGKQKEEASPFPMDIGNPEVPFEVLYNSLFDEDGNPRPVPLPLPSNVSLDEDKENAVPGPGPSSAGLSSLDKGKGKEIGPAPEMPKEDPFSFFENMASVLPELDEDKENAAPVPGPSVEVPRAVGPSSAGTSSLDATASRVQVNPSAGLSEEQIKLYLEIFNDPDTNPEEQMYAEAKLQGADV